MLEGSVDLVTTERTSGWLSDRQVDVKWDVVAKLNGAVIGEAKAILSRPDLASVGFHDGNCGFDLHFYHPISPADLGAVTVHPRDSSLAIPRTSNDSYLDIIEAVTKKYPGSGRSRTLYGGLWTDRTDSLQILSGKLSAGLCAAEVFSDLRALISDGLVAIPVPAPNSADGAAKKRDLAELAPRFLNERVAAFLKYAFDDTPVANRIDILTATDERYLQTGAIEPMSSPAECVACYFSLDGQGSRIDYVLDSHELPEFGKRGLSRWTAEGSVSLPIIAASSERPVRGLALEAGRCVFVGPGLIHRCVPAQGQSVARVLLAPKRVTPLRLLANDAIWREIELPEGVKGRI